MATKFRYTPNVVKLEISTTALRKLTTLVIKAIVHIFQECVLELEIQ